MTKQLPELQPSHPSSRLQKGEQREKMAKARPLYSKAFPGGTG